MEPIFLGKSIRNLTSLEVIKYVKCRGSFFFSCHKSEKYDFIALRKRKTAKRNVALLPPVEHFTSIPINYMIVCTKSLNFVPPIHWHMITVILLHCYEENVYYMNTKEHNINNKDC